MIRKEHSNRTLKTINKFQKLRFRISAMTEKKQSIEYLNEIKWVKRRIEDYEAGVIPSKEDLLEANGLWKKHSNNPEEVIEIMENNGWGSIDYWIDEGKLIFAIKEYRKIHACSLKEAKEAIDNRKRKLKNTNVRP